MNDQNALAAASHVMHAVGPTIQMGDGSYFDFEAPETTTMTIEDYAWALAGTARFRGQTRSRLMGGARCIYNVAQHCVLGARQVFFETRNIELALAFLMHESDEVPFGDIVGPAKPLLGDDFKVVAKRCAAGIDKRFDVTCPDHDLIKRYDIRMLATEKRDLMPQGRGHQWSSVDGYDAFAFEILPWDSEPSARNFLLTYQALRS